MDIHPVLTPHHEWDRVECGMEVFYFPPDVSPIDCLDPREINERETVEGRGARFRGSAVPQPIRWRFYEHASEALKFLFRESRDECRSEVFEIVDVLLDESPVEFQTDEICTPEQTNVGIVVDEYAGGGDKFAREVFTEPSDAAVCAVELAEKRGDVE